MNGSWFPKDGKFRASSDYRENSVDLSGQEDGHEIEMLKSPRMRNRRDKITHKDSYLTTS